MSAIPSSTILWSHGYDSDEDTELGFSQGLSEGKNCDGRPVWEPPVFDYSALIGEEDYKQKREALLKHNKGDRVMTTKILDIHEEYDALMMYKSWVYKNVNEAMIDGDLKRKSFFRALSEEVEQDWRELYCEYKQLGVHTRKKDDGSYDVKTFDPNGGRFAIIFDQPLYLFVERSDVSVAEFGNESPSADERAASAMARRETTTQAANVDFRHLFCERRFRDGLGSAITSHWRLCPNLAGEHSFTPRSLFGRSRTAHTSNSAGQGQTSDRMDVD